LTHSANLPAPYLLDRWEDQVALEQEMLAGGRERMQERINKARKKRDMTRLRPYRSLIKEFVKPTADCLRDWIETSSQKRGVRPVALSFLRDTEAETAAVVALRAVFRMLGVEKRMVLGMALEIGAAIEHELRCERWMEEDRETWDALQSIYSSRGSDSAHQRRSRISIFNKHIAAKIGYEDWTEEQRQRVGLQMIDCVVRGTQRFKVVADRSQASSPKRGHRVSWPMVLQADDEMVQWLKSAMEDELVFWPVYSPTLIPPKPWEGPKGGAYWTPFVRAPFLIRFRANHETQRQRAIDEYEAIDMPNVYEALNFVQDTPWRVNTRVLDVASEVWEKDLALAGLPRQEEETVPQRPEAAEHDEDIRKRWAKAAGEVRTRNAKRLSKFIGTRRVLMMAERFREDQEIYFPHMLDFRGRMYPITSDLSPQGEDLHRGLLTFSGGKPIGETGAGWLAVHLANVWGRKGSFKERVEWVMSNDALFESIADAPLSSREWCLADSPWQCLAAIFEWVGFLREGPDYVCSLPTRVDGSCNGIQHLSAMVLDEVGAASVNLIPADKPEDIYDDVAKTLQEELVADAEVRGDVNALLWLRLFGRDGATRSITKRPVMILPYGGTRFAYMQYTMEWLDEHDPQKLHIPITPGGGDPEVGKDGKRINHRYNAVSYLVSKLWTAVGKHVVRGREVMDWLKACSAVVSETGLPIYWTTPCGFVVRHFYGQREDMKVNTRIDGQSLSLKSWKTTPTLDTKSVAKGIAPNFVHSMDASAMMSCAVRLKEAGVQHFTTIHDSYGCLPADMPLLYDILREAFVETYSQPVLEQFLSACRVVAPYENFPPVPKMGGLDLEQVRKSDYFFA
jgi:DNA-directed RNA polymerase